MQNLQSSTHDAKRGREREVQNIKYAKWRIMHAIGKLSAVNRISVPLPVCSEQRADAN